MPIRYTNRSLFSRNSRDAESAALQWEKRKEKGKKEQIRVNHLRLLGLEGSAPPPLRFCAPASLRHSKRLVGLEHFSVRRRLGVKLFYRIKRTMIIQD